MKERPILFSAPMIKALLDDRKTQTRRIVKNPEYHGCLTGDCPHWEQTKCDEFMRAESPHGKPGDRLWVRESFYIDDVTWIGNRLPTVRPVALTDDFIFYRADGECCDQIPECCCAEVGKPKWRPSIFMPRWASRITLEIIDVRVQRLKAISAEDCLAEGFGEAEGSGRTVEQKYGALWNSINGNWDENPWVWCISFRRLETA